MNTLVSDAARRVADTYMLHRQADFYGTLGHWFAVRLTDGTEDHKGTVYASKKAAMLDQKLDEKYYAFVQITPSPMTPEDAEIFLRLHRKMYEKGLRLGDSDKSFDVIKRLGVNDQAAQLRAMFRGDAPPTNIILPH